MENRQGTVKDNFPHIDVSSRAEDMKQYPIFQKKVQKVMGKESSGWGNFFPCSTNSEVPILEIGMRISGLWDVPAHKRSCMLEASQQLSFTTCPQEYFRGRSQELKGGKSSVGYCLLRKIKALFCIKDNFLTTTPFTHEKIMVHAVLFLFCFCDSPYQN